METVPVPLETEVLLQDNYKRNSDLSHLEYLALKSAIDYFGDELIHWLGIKEKAVRSAPTEIVELLAARSKNLSRAATGRHSVCFRSKIIEQ